VVWYARASVGDIRSCCAQASGNQIKRFDTTVAKGQHKDSARAFEGLAVKGNGEAHIRADPPLIVPIRNLVDRAGARRLELAARMLLDPYPTRLSGDRRRLLERYRYADLALKVVGVGSVGNALLGDPAAGTRPERCAVPSGKGGAALLTRAVRRPAWVFQPRGSGWSRASG
jgi:Uncharacterized protein conserved in bacteria (DUF2252)